jgi:hypothetical protein
MAEPIYSQNLTVQSYIALLLHSAYSPISPVNLFPFPQISSILTTLASMKWNSLVADGDEEDTYQNPTDTLIE